MIQHKALVLSFEDLEQRRSLLEDVRQQHVALRAARERLEQFDRTLRAKYGLAADKPIELELIAQLGRNKECREEEALEQAKREA